MMMLWMALGLIAGVFGIVHVVFIREDSSPHTLKNKSLQCLAQELGLKFTLRETTVQAQQNLYGQLSGTIHGFQIIAYEEPTHHGEQVPFRSVYEIHTNRHNLSETLLLYREGPPSKVGKVLGGEDIEVDIATIDQAFVIRDTSPQSAQTMFARPGVAEAFLHLTTLTPGVFFENHKLTLTHSGTRLQPQQARATILALLECARLLCDQTDGIANRQDVRTNSRKFKQGASPTWQAAP